MNNNGVYFVDIVGDKYQVRAAGELVYTGDEAGYKAFVQEHKQSVFIIDDIPRS